MRRISLLSGLVVVAVLIIPSPAVRAHPTFKIQFDKKYMIEGSPLYVAMQGKTTCNICHVGPGKGKRNEYGVAIGLLLGRGDLQNIEKMQQAFEKVESEKCGDTTFGALIKEGKLPVTK